MLRLRILRVLRSARTEGVVGNYKPFGLSVGRFIAEVEGRVASRTLGLRSLNLKLQPSCNIAYLLRTNRMLHVVFMPLDCTA